MYREDMPPCDHAHLAVTFKQNAQTKSLSFKIINDGVRNAIKRNQINLKLSNRGFGKKKDLEKIKLFAGICKSDKFTLEQAYEDFAHIPLTTQSADI